MCFVTQKLKHNTDLTFSSCLCLSRPAFLLLIPYFVKVCGCEESESNKALGSITPTTTTVVLRWEEAYLVVFCEEDFRRRLQQLRRFCFLGFSPRNPKKQILLRKSLSQIALFCLFKKSHLSPLILPFWYLNIQGYYLAPNFINHLKKE